MINFFCKLWLNNLKPFWSKIRWKKQRKEKAIAGVSKVIGVETIRQACNEVYNHFEWTMDDASQLFDSYRPIEALYNEYLRSCKDGFSTKIKDDCDGFHSIIYHILTQNNYDCALLTIVTRPIKESHTMCLYKVDDHYYLVNYTSVTQYPKNMTIQEIVNQYNEAKGYKKEHCWCLHKYNYNKASFYTIKEL